jgi:exoribonuclease-2
MVEKGLEPDFSRDALAELDAIRGPASPAGVPGLRDMRGRPWMSIDNDDSKDLDQLTLAEPGENGATRIFVAVADVDSLVAKGTAIDAHARRNTTSVYTAAEIFPMLRRSCRRPDVAERGHRPARARRRAGRREGRVARAFRHLPRGGPQPGAARLRLRLGGMTGGDFPEKAQKLPGAIEQLRLRTPSPRPFAAAGRRGSAGPRDDRARAVFANDEIVGLAVQPKNRARQLIEDFMIAANGVTARFLASKGLASLRRVVRSPERWQKIVAVRAELGEQASGEATAGRSRGSLRKRRKADPLRFPDLSLVIVKLMGAGEYVVERPGQPATGTSVSPSATTRTRPRPIGGSPT